MQEEDERYNPCQDNMSGSYEKSWTEHIFEHPSMLKYEFTRLSMRYLPTPQVNTSLSAVKAVNLSFLSVDTTVI